MGRCFQTSDDVRIPCSNVPVLEVRLVSLSSPICLRYLLTILREKDIEIGVGLTLHNLQIGSLWKVHKVDTDVSQTDNVEPIAVVKIKTIYVDRSVATIESQREVNFTFYSFEQ